MQSAIAEPASQTNADISIVHTQLIQLQSLSTAVIMVGARLVYSGVLRPLWRLCMGIVIVLAGCLSPAWGHQPPSLSDNSSPH